ncbi:hypothetical protein FBR01_06930 [Anaerolineae bacterium CFX8]|nr:hypothetical protein [Anaerolineae bacterium CFX8]
MRRFFALVMILLCNAAAAAAQNTPFSAAELQLLIQARTDLELLANQQLGSERPVGWSGSLDANDPQLALLLRLDLELLAGTLLAPDQRPLGWFGAIPGSPFTIARDVRHDLELLADTVSLPGVRPNGWAGSDPLMRCSRPLQALVYLLERGGTWTLTADPFSPDFCRLAELEAVRFAESTSAPPASAAPAPADAAAPSAAVPPGSAQITGSLALGFLNRYATEHVGTIPVGTVITPVARSFTQFSRMTLVRGEGFELFVDYRDTSITDAEFAALPDVNGLTPNPTCTADWCRSVTFTVGSPAAGRPLPGESAPAASSPGGRVKVPVEHLIIYYDGPDAENSVVVRLQLCAKPSGQAGNTCQNVSEVLAPGGAALTPVGTLNGMPQFRLPYGYSAHTLYAPAYYMTDVWIAAPGQGR